MRLSHTPSFVEERRILTPSIYDCDFLDKKFNIGNKIYNTACKHYIKVIENLYRDTTYIDLVDKFKNSGDEKEKKLILKEISNLMKKYKLTEYDIHAYIAVQKQQAFNKGIGINIAQKLGSNLYSAIKKAVFRNNKIHFRKYGTTCSLEDKRADSGIIYKDETVKIMGRVYKLKPIREKDYFMQECMTHTIKYCRVVRKPFANGYKYFLQIVFEGVPPQKLVLGSGKCGIDEGISTIATYNDVESSFKVLGDGIEAYNKEIKKYNNEYQRRMRFNNPQCFDENGSFKKGSKFSNRSKNSKKSLMKLKNAYRKRKVFINQLHNKYINELIEQCDTIIKEPMNFKAFQKKAKTTERSEKETEVKTKDGNSKVIKKFKKKKRFGKSINNRSPGLFNKKLEEKFSLYGGTIINVDLKNYKASKINHITKEAERVLLSDRTKRINGQLVQRDIYSAFLLYNMETVMTIDYNSCELLFNDFIEKQQKVIEKVKTQGDTTKNFGLKDLLKQ